MDENRELPEQQTEQSQSPENTYEQTRRASAAMKKKILLSLAILLGALVVVFGVVKLLELLPKKDAGVPDGTYSFYAPYAGDIMEYPAYLELNRAIKYCADPQGYGLTQEVNESTRGDLDPEVIFLCDWIKTIIDGDAVVYNDCFSEAYWEENPRNYSFHQQMLYNITLTYQSTEPVSAEEKRVTYRLEYMIFQNDGSYRRDIGSDMSRPQSVTVSSRTDGTIAIESIVTHYTNLND